MAAAAAVGEDDLRRHGREIPGPAARPRPEVERLPAANRLIERLQFLESRAGFASRRVYAGLTVAGLVAPFECKILPIETLTTIRSKLS
jgi:hypothetical protein